MRGEPASYDHDEFTVKRLGGLKWHIRLSWWNDRLQKILENPDEFLEKEAEILKKSGSSTVGRADGFVVKRSNKRKIGCLLKDVFRSSRARVQYQKAQDLELAGIATPRPVATTDRRLLRVLFCSYFVMEEIRGATQLQKWCGDRRQATRRVAQLLGKLHHAGFTHRDLKSTNIVFAENGLAYLLDLEGLRYVRNVSEKQAAADLARLARSVRELSRLSQADCLCFLKHYCRCRGVLNRSALWTQIRSRVRTRTSWL
jgi:tRNA A-37 threonylcarbamoyl transferase component Bud32